MSQLVQVIRRFVVKIHCNDCGGVLNTSTPFENKEQLSERWANLCFSGALMAGKCPNGCRSTFSDMNINTRMIIYDADSGDSFKGQHINDIPALREELV